MKRVVVGLSGGVDSSVAAYLLQKQGYEVIGIFMRNWHDDSVLIDDECPWIEDSNDAMLVAEKLNIPFQVIDLSAAYKTRIVDYMFKEYEEGRTPNPDVLCNREIKFDLFLKAALQLKADFVATGHYCRTDKFVNSAKELKHRLLSGLDRNKDQSYFLCQLNQEQLSKAIFPIGHLQKSEVRAIAKEMELVTAEKKDSQGLCFIGKVKLPTFLQQQLKSKKGDIIQIPRSLPIYKEYNELEQDDFQSLSNSYDYEKEMGHVVGQHIGAHFFTIGQRKGLAVGGTTEPLFVIGTDVKTNTVYVGEGDTHPGLYRNHLFVNNSEINWLRDDLEIKIWDSYDCEARIRYRQELVKCSIKRLDSGLYFIFEQPQRGIASGQFVAWYSNNELVGSGVID